MANRQNPILRGLSFLAALALLGGIFFGALAMLKYTWTWQPVFNYRQVFWEGWLATLAISGLALPLSCTLGLLFALRRKRFRCDRVCRALARSCRFSAFATAGVRS